ncbi:hypothetical protein OSB04_030311 [Centaurea solstitialis]|uniref:Uncharacterized protein n=1 Tax=Centaurea solstitialis TaxID=347529 RepID=A0AA38SSM7_9ASTR|nr:hypothetical protein OSB04_030311 [Centaurea solstitialis]
MKIVIKRRRRKVYRGGTLVRGVLEKQAEQSTDFLFLLVADELKSHITHVAHLGAVYLNTYSVEHQVLKDEKVDFMRPTLWEQNLPNDYEQIIKWSKYSLEWSKKRKLYHRFCRGFLINKGEELFSLAKNGKKYLMQPAAETLVYLNGVGSLCPHQGPNLSQDVHSWPLGAYAKSSHLFKEMAFNCHNNSFSIIGKTKSRILLPGTTYACYLVYNIIQNHPNSVLPLKMLCREKQFTQYSS